MAHRCEKPHQDSESCVEALSVMSCSCDQCCCGGEGERTDEAYLRWKQAVMCYYAEIGHDLLAMCCEKHCTYPEESECESSGFTCPSSVVDTESDCHDADESHSCPPSGSEDCQPPRYENCVYEFWKQKACEYYQKTCTLQC